MRHRTDTDAVAREIIDLNSFMTLATANADGLPWASPVWFAPAGYTEFFWVSDPEARHSRNLATRPDLSIVIFDSQVPISTGQGVYMAAVGEEVGDVDLDRGIGVFSTRSRSHGGDAWTRDDVRPPALLRLYRATASEHFVLDPAATVNRRTAVTP